MCPRKENTHHSQWYAAYLYIYTKVAAWICNLKKIHACAFKNWNKSWGYYYALPHDVASGCDITSCIKMDKPLVNYRFSNIMTSIIIMLGKRWQNLDVSSTRLIYSIKHKHSCKILYICLLAHSKLPLFVWFDSLGPSQHFFSHAGTSLPG